MGCRIILLVIYCFQGLACLGNLKTPELKISLEAEAAGFHPNAILPLKLKIENVSGHHGSILIPYAQNTGKSLFELRISRIDAAGNYVLVYTSPVDLDMDTSKYKSTESFWQLEPNESFLLPFFINDTKNSRKRFESSIVLPELAEGNYAFQMIYHPENSRYFNYAFLADGVTDPIPEDQVDSYPDHFRWDGSIVSNFLEINCSNSCQSVMHENKSHCAVCKHVYNENWKKLKNKWDKRSIDISHPTILWIYPGPQAILASLPTYFGYDAILLTKSGINYISCNYQVGKIFRARSRMAWLFHAVGFRRAPFKTSKVDWCKLKSITQR